MGDESNLGSERRRCAFAMRAARACGDPYKLMLIDSQMPGMDGFALVERIRRLPGAAPATIMMLTPEASVERLRDAPSLAYPRTC